MGTCEVEQELGQVRRRRSCGRAWDEAQHGPSVQFLGRFSRPLALVFVNPVCPGEKEGQTQEQRNPKSCVCGGDVTEGLEAGEMSVVSRDRSPHQGVPQVPTPLALA